MVDPESPRVANLPGAYEEIERKVMDPAGKKQVRVLEQAVDVGQRSEPPVGTKQVRCDESGIEQAQDGGMMTPGISLSTIATAEGRQRAPTPAGPPDLRLRTTIRPTSASPISCAPIPNAVHRFPYNLTEGGVARCMPTKP